MTDDFKKTATNSGNIERNQVTAAVLALKATAATTNNDLERANALLQLERLGETI